MIIFYFGQDAKGIRDRKKTVATNHQIIYGHLNVKKNYVSQFNGQSCFKIGKTQSDPGGLCIRENRTNQSSAVDHTDFIAVLPPGASHADATKIEGYARDLMRRRPGFQKIPDAHAVDAAGNEWTAWSNNWVRRAG